MGKLIGWLLSMSFIIAGIGFAISYSQTNFMPYTGFSILSFGCVFWLSKTTFQNSKRVMSATTIILVGTGLVTHLVLADIVQAYANIGEFLTWEIVMLVVGLPVMRHVFKTEPPS
jgi:hypothetical protein